MIKLYKKIIFSFMFFFMCWIIIIGTESNWNFHNIHLNLYATVRQFEHISNDNWFEMVQTLGNQWKAIKFNFNFDYVQISDLASFFQNVGIWFNGIWKLLVNFFQSIGGVFATLIYFLIYCFEYLFGIMRFIFNPVIM